MSVVNLGTLLAACVDLSHKVGDIMRTVYQSGNLGVKMKGVDDPCTKADIEGQQLIIAALRNVWPQLSIVAEENCEIPPNSYIPNMEPLEDLIVPEKFKEVPLEDIVLWIDPLDGTNEFTKGRVWAVANLIGISIKGVSEAGVAYFPFLGNTDANIETPKPQLYYGITGGSVVCRPPLSSTASDDDAVRPLTSMTLVVTRSHMTEAFSQFLKRINPKKIINAGGAGYKAHLVFSGEGDLYIHSGTGPKKWDICAFHSFLRHFGGDITTMLGNPIHYSVDTTYENPEGLCLMRRVNPTLLSIFRENLNK